MKTETCALWLLLVARSVHAHALSLREADRKWKKKKSAAEQRVCPLYSACALARPSVVALRRRKKKGRRDCNCAEKKRRPTKEHLTLAHGGPAKVNEPEPQPRRDN